MHGERIGEGNSLAQNLGVLSGLQPREGLISQALAHVVNWCHEFLASLAYCNCEVHQERLAWTTSYMANKTELKWIVTQGWAKGQRGSQLALHYVNCRGRNIVWRPGAHPAICNCKWSTALLGPGTPLLPQLLGTRSTQVAATTSHLVAHVQSFTSSQQELGASLESSQSSRGCSANARVFARAGSEKVVSRLGT